MQRAGAADEFAKALMFLEMAGRRFFDRTLNALDEYYSAESAAKDKEDILRALAALEDICRKDPIGAMFLDGSSTSKINFAAFQDATVRKTDQIQRDIEQIRKLSQAALTKLA
eukprot:TRINITY_DN6193_c0_g1_i1.p1 TRINITY_DN6193_c0_g1~~TRINITY_DN6193_c0_g1_i1.p1  ORF type:complete len:113 (-),score=9.47 TRINITY_DN6193_c0_g1_i1:109-447(-)